MSQIDAIGLGVFANLFSSTVEEMGAILARDAHSPHIREGSDLSCACFLAAAAEKIGESEMIALFSQAPIHLAALPASVHAAVQTISAPWAPGDRAIVNDPLLGGTHVPDLTMISPVFFAETHGPQFFLASRAHHTDTTDRASASNLKRRDILREGPIIPPIKLVAAGEIDRAVLDLIRRNVPFPDERQADLNAQLAAHGAGERRLHDLVARYSLEETIHHARSLLAHAERLARTAIARIPNGTYRFATGTGEAEVQATVAVQDDSLTVELGSHQQAMGSFVDAAIRHALRFALGAEVPLNGSTWAPLCIVRAEDIDAEPGHPAVQDDAALAGRVVGAVLGALAQALPDLQADANRSWDHELAFRAYDPGRAPKP